MTDPADRYERLLRAARPAPRLEFVRDLEHALLSSIESPPPPRRSPLPGLVAGFAFAAALGAVVVVLAVTGLLPLGLGRDEPVSASQQHRANPCRIVVTAPERVGRATGECQDSGIRRDGP